MTYQSKPYQPLTADNSALVLVDHQVGLMTGVRDYEIGELKHNVVALAKAAKVLGVPVTIYRPGTITGILITLTSLDMSITRLSLTSL